MRDIEDEVRDIKKEIVESRSLVIRTNNLVNSLAGDVKSIARRQNLYEKRLVWSSAAAYTLVAVASFLGLKMAYDAREAGLRSRVVALRKTVARQKLEQDEGRRRVDARARAERHAAEFYELVRTGKRAEAVAAYDVMTREPLSPVETSFFRDATERFRGELSLAAYQDGLRQRDAERWPDAARALETALRIKPDAPHASASRVALADVVRRLGRAREALTLVETALADGSDREIADDAAYIATQCHMDLHETVAEREALAAFQRRFPGSRYMPLVRMRLAQIRMAP